jgi:hypothetical protein
MYLIREITIELQLYHDEIVGRLIYNDQSREGEKIESSLYSLSEIGQLVLGFQANHLAGSFGIGHKLARDCVITLAQKVQA